MSKHLSIQLSKQLNRSIEQVSACCFTHLFLIKQLNASAEQTSAYEVNEQVSSCYSDTCSWDHNPQCRITDHLSAVIQRSYLRSPGDPSISSYPIHKCISSVQRIHNKATSTNKPPIRCERVGYVPTLTHLDLLLGSTLMLWGIPLDLAILLRQIKTHIKNQEAPYYFTDWQH